MAANMNKMIAPVATYSDLDARTQFVLNRVEFLKSITDVLQHEDLSENKAKVTVWRDNSYIPLIVRCILDPNEEIYDHAIWATGNLLGSDDEQVVLMTRNAITEEVLKRLVELAGNKTLSSPLRRGVNYLLYNLSKYSLPESILFAIGGPLLRGVLSDERIAGDKEARGDFLAAISNILKNEPKAINVDVLVEALAKNNSNSVMYRRVLRLVGALAELDGMISITDIGHLMTIFSKHLNNTSRLTRRDMLWILSNLLTEFSAPVVFIRDNSDLKKMVQDIVWEELCCGKDNGDVILGREALFALANFVSTIKQHYANSGWQDDVTNDFVLEGLFGACSDHADPQIAQLGLEGLEMLDSFKPIKAEEEIIDLTEDTESEVEDNYTETEETYTEDECYVHKPPASSVAGWQPPLAHTNAVVSCCEEPVPSAADLLLGAGRGNESASVRRVVNLLVHLPVGEWAEVPADWTLAVADLTVLQHLGYVIHDGYVGINPEIFSGY
jgi:hypothetical protein